MIQRLFTVALLAGFCAGLAVSLVQFSWSVPLIQQAETYESAAPAHHHAGAPHEIAGPAQAHDDADWAPADGVARAVMTFLTNLLLGVGGGLLLAGIFALRRTQAGWKSGLMWGAGAFAAFFLAPASGLPPELPGTAAAELDARQSWWLLTVIATGAGLAVLAFAAKTAVRVLGVVLIAVPHIVGAPQPAHHEALAPLALQHEFIAAALVASACFWLVLGAATGHLAGRFRLGVTLPAAPEAA